MSDFGNRGKKSYKRNSGKVERYGSRKIRLSFVLQFIVIGIFVLVFGLYLLSSIARGKETESKSNLALGTDISDTTSDIENESILDIDNGNISSEDEDVRAGDIKFDNVSLDGLSKVEAREKILDLYKWNIQLSYSDNFEMLQNPLPDVVDSFLAELYGNSDMPDNGEYQLDQAQIENNLRTQLSVFAERWDKEPLSAQLTGRSDDNNQWIYSDGEAGIKVNQDKTIQSLMNLVSERNFESTVDVAIERISAGSSATEIKKQYQIISTFSTVATDNQNRNNNISLAMDALDGLVIKPGEEFSFNKTTGNRTIERGYKPAGAYRNGEFVEEPGGGVCQVSSTLYNAIIFSGIKVKERNPHSYEPSYVVPGEDAMVSYDGYSGPDLRFVNNQSTSVAIRAVFENKKLTISIVGIPILDDGVEVSMRSEKIKTNSPLEPKYEEDPTLQPGEEVEVSKGISSTVWKTYIITKKDGVLVSEENFHSTTYRAKAAVIRRNSTAVLPSEEPTESGESSMTDGAVPEDEGAIVDTSPPEITEIGTSESNNEANEENVIIVPNHESQKSETEADSPREVGPGIE